MRAKKARKRLARVETVLADIIDQYADPPPGLSDLIATAQSKLVPNPAAHAVIDSLHVTIAGSSDSLLLRWRENCRSVNLI